MHKQWESYATVEKYETTEHKDIQWWTKGEHDDNGAHDENDENDENEENHEKNNHETEANN